MKRCTLWEEKMKRSKIWGNRIGTCKVKGPEQSTHWLSMASTCSNLTQFLMKPFKLRQQLRRLFIVFNLPRIDFPPRLLLHRQRRRRSHHPFHFLRFCLLHQRVVRFAEFLHLHFLVSINYRRRGAFAVNFRVISVEKLLCHGVERRAAECVRFPGAGMHKKCDVGAAENREFTELIVESWSTLRQCDQSIFVLFYFF